MEYVDLTLFSVITIGHLLFMPWWMRRRWGERPSNREELFFHSIVIGFGSLQAVLHLLACTIGISLAAGLVALAALHGAIHLWQTARPPSPNDRLAPSLRIAPGAISGRSGARRSDVKLRPLPWWLAFASRAPWLSLLGATAVATCALSWRERSAQSFQILGIDAEHYHVPYAINYAHGESIFGFAATPHLYPMGTSILAVRSEATAAAERSFRPDPLPTCAPPRAG